MLPDSVEHYEEEQPGMVSMDGDQTNSTINTQRTSFQNLNATSQFIIKNIKSIAQLRQKRKIFDTMMLFCYYCKDKKKLKRKLVNFRENQLKKKTIKVFTSLL